MYVDLFGNWADVQREFTTKEPEPDKVLYAKYSDEDYSGDALVVFEKAGRLYLVEGGHCSCYGLEGQWDPEETTLEALHHMAEKGRYSELKEVLNGTTKP